VMHRLAKLGFSQSYTYFAWRNTKGELIDYFTELTATESREYFRPNAWPNTPDILTEYLQFGGRPAFMARLTLAATLCANYGIYGPAYELCENRPREPGIGGGEQFQAHDLLSDARYLWLGARNYVELNPQISPAHLFRLRRRQRTERDFDYFA